ncbi:UIF factor, partial [Polypterus senegalus]
MSETAFRSNNEASLNTDQISDAVDKIDMSLGFNRIGIRGRRLQPPSRRRPQGVLTGLALRKAQPLNKGVSPLNRQAFHMMRARQMLQGRLNTYRQPSGLWMPLSASSSRWRMTTTNNGILTVSIDNPAARLFAETQLPLSLIKQEESEPKIPKGVPLQFDINSVGKQTAMTLNERFKILKEQRTANSYLRGSRFITVG